MLIKHLLLTDRERCGHQHNYGRYRRVLLRERDVRRQLYEHPRYQQFTVYGEREQDRPCWRTRGCDSRVYLWSTEFQQGRVLQEQSLLQRRTLCGRPIWIIVSDNQLNSTLTYCKLCAFTQSLLVKKNRRLCKYKDQL